jgi:hypothetical protein
LVAGGLEGAGVGVAGFVVVSRFVAPEPVVVAGVVAAGLSVRAMLVSLRFDIA